MSVINSRSRQLLAVGIDRLGLVIADAQQQQLLDYLTLLLRWNKAFNLTSIRELDEGISRHLLDSLAILPYVGGPRLIDIGSGGGLPGIPLAICRPDLAVTCLDSNSKKTRFLVQAKGELGLSNLNVVHCRAEQYQPEQRYHQVVSRAFAQLGNIMGWSAHLLADGGEFLAMKGGIESQELAGIPDGYSLVAQYGLMVPGLEQEQRHLLVIRPSR